ncbi:MAG: serine protease [Deltaproteobacteria bacterium]|nr:serine protease [Deltaproteobacteria bacterium]
MAGWLVLAAAGPLSAQPPAPVNPFPDLAERRRALGDRMEAATVFIVAIGRHDMSSGSGFVVGDGLILTNGHVVAVEGPTTILILNDSLPPTEARIIAIDYDPSEDEGLGGRDFALLSFESESNRRLPVLSFNLEARKMDLVGAWGFPSAVLQFDRNFQDLASGRLSDLKSPSVVFTEGTISALVEGGLGTVIMHSASVSSGNSGGPLVNLSGEVVGVNTQRYARQEDLAVLNIALSASDIVAFLVESGVTPVLSEGQSLASLEPRPSRPNRSRPERPAEPERDRRGRERRQPEDDGQTKTLTSFSIKVPSGWGVIYEEEDSIVLGTHDLSTNMWIMVAANHNLTLEEVARFYSILLEGSDPRLEDNDVYVFESVDDEGSPTVVAVSGIDDERHVMISLSGDPDDPGIDAILESLEGQ